ncbi:transcription-repair coupling factor [Motilimonas sp. 1_MG-2023]|uniref:transcription-repair coupling factor n=1 Tax=Motilimonas sp. 1_MG-2023 TaxID=3062672 RepID=UPI0026E44DFD|nr:transcription-repair coupling factor [Motilimonas sp. 1_MG-2023]MDO6524738.1 transcription-repair coupling factor [Motilimonas sp. 1_MG-2023]
MTVSSLLTLPALKKAGDKQFLGQLSGSSLALGVAEFALQHQGMVLLLVADTPSALRLEQEVTFFLQGKKPVLSLPDWETLPYDSFSPHQDIISTRLTTLYRLPQVTTGVLIVPVATLLLRCAPASYLTQHSLLLNTGEQRTLQSLRQQLEQAGYYQVEQVMEHGEYSARGAVFDLFPMGSTHPYRLDYFDDEIESIKEFDPETQRSTQTVKSIELLPAREFPTDKAAIERFRSQYRERFNASREAQSVYQQVSKGTFPAGIEYYLPLFFEQTACLFDYLPDTTAIAVVGDIQQAATHFLDDVEQRYENRRHDIQRPLLPPHELYLRIEECFSQLKQFPRLHFSEATLNTEKAGYFNAGTQSLPTIAVSHNQPQPLAALTDFLADFDGKVLFCVESQGRRETLLSLLDKVKLKPKQFQQLVDFTQSEARLGLIVGDVSRSFILPSANIAFICETELLGDRVVQRRRKDSKKTVNTDALIRNLAELAIGQAVVHLDHGIGRYQGLQTLDIGGMETEYLTLEYAGGDKLYVPVTALHLISRYSGGDDETAHIHKLGGETWSKAKRRAAEKVRDVAAELLNVYANREVKPGHIFAIDKEQYASFAAAFPFEETDDQISAINAVLSDMSQNKAMDRLVCGDVGFGKTEVAMRAAFVAVNAGKQVAVLVPTTLLAQQHYENFKDRFADWPVEVEVMSRFKTAKEQKEVLVRLKEGKVDILIGTHKLLGADIEFIDLGLLIVDEEHRFGVRQKEKIKALRANIDILTLTATPIPRTLNMAMSGMRDLSIIATPPAKRLAVKTFVRQREDALIKEAITREIMRGGQVYFLHNAVDTIEKTAADLAELVPEARIIVGHGQMRERELEKVMSDFYHQRYNILVCTTIIETGIDVPTANTMIIDRADNLGLAQLHQLRGRVGRSHHQAYAYLLAPHKKLMSKDAKKRLEAIASLEALGAGFTLATHDLEIRGAGELLGDDQSGQIHSIGFSLYMEMLEQAVNALREGKEPDLTQLLNQQTEIELRIPALLPDDYIGDVNMRLSLYKRIASCTNKDELDDLQIELIDRFGLLPEPSKHLLKVAEFKLAASAIGIKKIEAHAAGGYIEFAEKTKVNPAYLVSLLQNQPKIYRMEGPTRLRFAIPAQERSDRIKLVQTMLTALTENTL